MRPTGIRSESARTRHGIRKESARRPLYPTRPDPTRPSSYVPSKSRVATLLENVDQVPSFPFVTYRARNDEGKGE